MKPTKQGVNVSKIGKSISADQLKSKPKYTKKHPKLSITPITSFFKKADLKRRALSPAAKVQSPKPASPHTPHSSHTSTPRSRQSPVSRSSIKNRNNLTPVKLSSSFEFDFIKIPQAKKRTLLTASPARKLELGPPTPPSNTSHRSCPLPSPSSQKTPSQTSSLPPTPTSKVTYISSLPPTPTSQVAHTSPLTPTSQTSHISNCLSVEAPPFSPLSTPSPNTRDQIRFLHSVETPFPSKPSSTQLHTEEVLPSNEWKNPYTNQSHEAIVISSDSQESDIEGCCKSPLGRRSRISYDKVNKNGVILLDVSSESEFECPEPKKPCHIDLTKTASNSVQHTLMKDGKQVFNLTGKNDKPCSELETKGTISSAAKLEVSVSDDRAHRLREVESLLWKRGTPYCVEGHPMPAKVGLLNTGQSCVAENLLDSNCRFISDKINSLVQYLSTITSTRTIPKGESLANLVLMISDPYVVSSHVHPEVRDSCLSYLHQVLLLHPPGQHSQVDRQYRSFLKALEVQGGSFSLWEFMDTLSKGPAYCVHLLSILVDLLLSDYWATLQGSSCGASPLFLSVFWTSKEHCHMTSPIRQLLDGVCKLVEAFEPSSENMMKLDCLSTLLYLCSSVCADLSSNIVDVCKRLPPNHLPILLGRLHSFSLYSNVVNGLSDLEETLRKSEHIFNISLINCRSVKHEKQDEHRSQSISSRETSDANVSSKCLKPVKSSSTQLDSTQSSVHNSDFTSSNQHLSNDVPSIKPNPVGDLPKVPRTKPVNKVTSKLGTERKQSWVTVASSSRDTFPCVKRTTNKYPSDKRPPPWNQGTKIRSSLLPNDVKTKVAKVPAKNKCQPVKSSTPAPTIGTRFQPKGHAGVHLTTNAGVRGQPKGHTGVGGHTKVQPNNHAKNIHIKPALSKPSSLLSKPNGSSKFSQRPSIKNKTQTGNWREELSKLASKSTKTVSQTKECENCKTETCVRCSSSYL